MAKQDKYLPGKKGGIPNKQAIQQKAQAHAIEAIEVLVEAMRNGDNTNARVGAAKTLLNKCLPDLKATELSGDEQKALVVRILGYGNNNNASAETEGSSK